MNRVFLVMVVSALLVTFGFAQTPDAGSNAAPANVKGCLGGSEGNYTVVEDGTRQTFKISSSTVDLKPQLGHDVKLIGHKAGGTASSGAADNSFAVTEVSMISEHCGAAAAAAAAATVIPPAETVIPPDPAPVAPATTAGAPEVAPAAPAATVAPSAAVLSTPAVEPAVPAVTVAVAPPPAPPATPAAEVAAPAAVGPSPSTPAAAVEASASVANDTHPARPSAHARKLAAAKAAAATESAEPVTPAPEPASAPAAEAATTAATAPPVSPSAENVTTPDATAPDAAAAPVPAETHRTGSLALLITFVVLVIVLGTTAPLIGRWRKRKALERDGSPNLSFTNDETATEVTTNEAASSPDKAGTRKVA